MNDHVSDHLLVATRKGLFALEHKRSGWASNGFPGIPVTNVLYSDGVLYAAIKYGHFGPKLHRSDDSGRDWREIATPAFAFLDAPPRPTSYGCSITPASIDRPTPARIGSGCHCPATTLVSP
jgi:hypothetical protein